MIPDRTYTNRGYYTSNQVMSRFMYLLSLKATGLPIKRPLSF